MRRSEWIAAGYFVYLLLPICLGALPRKSRWSLMLWALALAAAVTAVSRLRDASALGAVRDWAPGVYLVAGYWLPGRLFTAPNLQLERWLLATDDRLLARLRQGFGAPRGRRGTAAIVRLPWMARGYLELAYLFCYPLVPVAFGILYFSAAGQAARSSIADGFWSVVLLAVFACYGLLPWLPTRPPRVVLPRESIAQTSIVRRLNLLVLHHASIQVNTFPSGHVAAALASTLVVGQTLPAAGIIIGVLSLSIASAALVGRYHYAADVVLGALVAIAAFAAFSLH